jgi:hypothetical protein
MNEWSSYAIGDFIPFTREVYLRLIERVSETYWPLHMLMLVVVLGIVALTLKGRRLIAGLLLASIWGWVGYSFVLQFYANLNWAGHWVAWVFFVQALLLVVIMLSVHSNFIIQAPLRWSGLMLCVVGLGWPLLTRIGRDGWSQVEVVGVHADPTAVLTLGLALLLVRGWRLWLTAIIPLLWCLLSGLTLGVLGLPQAQVLYGIVGATIVAMLYALSSDLCEFMK